MSERILIKFKASGDKKLQSSMLRLAAAQGLLEKNTKEMQRALDRLTVAFNTNRKGSRLLNNTFATLRSKMLLFSFAMSLGGRQLIEFARKAAQVEAMGTAFNTLSGGTENANIAMDKLTKATDGTMSKFDLFQQANNAMILGVSKNSDEMSEMFDMAQRLGRALGVDTKRSVESLITGIGRQSRLMLDNIGIIVKSDQAYVAYAEKLGITVDKLTEADKKQAFLNATLEAARKKVAQLGDEVLSPIDSFNKLSASWDNFTVSVGNAMMDVFQPLLNILSSILDFMDEERIKSYTLSITLLAFGFGLVTIATGKATLALKGFKVAMMGTFIGIAVVALGEIINQLGIFEEEAEEAADSTNTFVDALARIPKTKASLQAEKEELQKLNFETSQRVLLIKLLKRSYRDLFGDEIELIENSKGLYRQQTLSNDQMKQQAKWLKDNKLSYKEFGDILIEFTEKEKLSKQQKEAIEEIEKRLLSLGDLKVVQGKDFIQSLKNEVEILKEKSKFTTGKQTKLEMEQAIALLKLKHQDIELDKTQKTTIEDLTKEKQKELDIIEDEKELKGDRESAQKYLDSQLSETEPIQAQIDLYAALQTEARLDKRTDDAILFGDAIRGLLIELDAADAAIVTLGASLLETFRGLGASSLLAFSNSFEEQIFNQFDHGVMKMRDFAAAFGTMMNQIIAKILAEQAILLLLNLLPGGGGKVGELFAAAIGHQGGQVQGYATGGIISNPSMQTYQGGGGVDNVPALLQEGEFVMRRSAVESIGLENLNRMNRTGQTSGGANITFTGNVMSDDFIEDEAIPKIKDAIRRGADIGIS